MPRWRCAGWVAAVSLGGVLWTSDIDLRRPHNFVCHTSSYITQNCVSHKTVDNTTLWVTVTADVRERGPMFLGLLMCVCLCSEGGYRNASGSKDLRFVCNG